MTQTGAANTEQVCAEMRTFLERLGDAPEAVDAAVARLRAERERVYCRSCGAYLVAARDGQVYPCWRCR